MKKRKKIKSSKGLIKFSRNRTFSFPVDVDQHLDKKENMSSYLAELVRADMQKEAAAATTITMTPEEIEIREALKERENAVKDEGEDKVDELENAIMNGRTTSIPDTWEHYFTVFKKYHYPSDNELYYVWRGVARKVREEKERQRELYLKEELTGGMTRGEVLDIIKEEPTGIRLTIKTIVELLGLPYSKVYNVVLPFLRKEGYEVYSSRD